MVCGKFPKCPESNGKFERIGSLRVFVEGADVRDVVDDNEESNGGLETWYEPYN